MTKTTIINHPLVQHKLTLLRQVETTTAQFRQLLKEICTSYTREFSV
ncbi:hypothetical protein [Okeania sp. SIO2C2]|nr:hypothetical protein [Okeania sp. SIO2C2]